MIVMNLTMVFCGKYAYARMAWALYYVLRLTFYSFHIIGVNKQETNTISKTNRDKNQQFQQLKLNIAQTLLRSIEFRRYNSLVMGECLKIGSTL